MTATAPGPGDNAAALRSYGRAIRARARVVAATTIAAVAVAALLLAMRTPAFTSTAQLLVTPLPQDDSTFLGTSLLRDSTDPTRTMQTAAALVSSPDAAARTAREIGGDIDQRAVQASISVQPLGESNVLSVTATATTPEMAARIANAYAQSILSIRGAEIQQQVDAIIQSLGARPGAGDRAELAELTAVRDRGDPTLLLSQPAQPPVAASGRSPRLILVLAAIAGFTLGSIAALLMVRRIADEDELAEVYPLPVLARVPAGGRPQRGAVLAGAPYDVVEAFRSLRLQLEFEDRDGGAILLTSASRAEGKTLTTVDLARELTAVGRRVIVIDLDLRRPQVAARLGVVVGRDLLGVSRRGDPLANALRGVPGNPLLRLAAPTSLPDARALERFETRLPALLDAARADADYVLLDGPPLGEVSDALHAVPLVDHVLVVARVGTTSRVALETLRDLLDRANRVATGYVVIGGVARRRGRGAYPPARGGRQPRRKAKAKAKANSGRRNGAQGNGARGNGAREKEMTIGRLRMDPRSGRTWWGTHELHLAPAGRRVLEDVMRRLPAGRRR
jgi:Mrp family chromosome partitioning ATPase/capsular polysaccharide biosynthesis protein